MLVRHEVVDGVQMSYAIHAGLGDLPRRVKTAYLDEQLRKARATENTKLLVSDVHALKSPRELVAVHAHRAHSHDSALASGKRVVDGDVGNGQGDCDGHLHPLGPQHLEPQLF